MTFGAQADAIAEHMAKGRRVAMVGGLEEWNNTQDRFHSKIEMAASEVEFLQAARRRSRDRGEPFGISLPSAFSCIVRAHQ